MAAMVVYVLRDRRETALTCAYGHTEVRALRRAGGRLCKECGGAAARQLAGQMALDMRPRSTCRRLTKAIPVPDMAKACHGDLDTVQLRPRCGHLGPGM
ncbi:hypothetical protein Saso_63540 [Streptomyces asoensis]|uniref:Uncharacterized protein n=1 Tax=Streptomyces asoensis TaxID=249586 RepID=A0ABQ3S9B5_9ACTN|nr:hypothetical protein GCM10010496_38610 [Streptomyces asoensis]GHI64704.1 hypothetical protein Saso_63540 [Streptomyces asoensis]